MLSTSKKNYKCIPLKLLLGYDEGRGRAMPTTKVKPEFCSKLIVEEGKVFFFDRNTGEMKEGKDYVLGKDRNQNNPVKIGRENTISVLDWIKGKRIGTKQIRDILLSEKYDYASREHCEIFYDAGEKTYSLVDYSLNGTLVNGNNVGGNKQRETRKLKHGDIIEIPAIGEKIKMTFRMHQR
jgi:hypothetical protein